MIKKSKINYKGIITLLVLLIAFISLFFVIIFTPQSARCVFLRQSIAGVRKQSQVSCSLDCFSQLTLMFRASTGNSSGKNLGTFGNETSQFSGIFIIDRLNFVHAELANLFLRFSSSGSSVFKVFSFCHCSTPP